MSSETCSENPRDQVRFVTTQKRAELMHQIAPKYEIEVILIRPGEIFVSGSGYSFLLKNGMGVGFILPPIATLRSFEKEVLDLENK